MTASVRLILGFSPGSMSDQIARAITPAFSRALGKDVDIALKPGNNGADAAAEVARARPDGLTLFVATLGTHALAPHLERSLSYDPLKDFEPVSLISSAPLVLACHESLGVSTPNELIALARARPGTLTYGTSAIGGAPHLAAELFQSLAGVTLEHVRYSHTERLYDDLEAGRIALTFNNMMSMLPRCKGGSIRALAVTSARRSAAAEHLPTLAECGLGDYEVSNWVGLVAPRGTPKNIVDTLSNAAATGIASPDVQSAFVGAGVTPRGSSPAEFTAFIDSELARWAPIVTRFRDTQPVTEASSR